MSAKKLALAALGATILAGILATHGFTSVPILRVKAVRGPTAPTAGHLVVPLPPNADLAALRPPVAFIWNVRNDGASPGSFDLAVDGTPVCREAVKGRTETRLDCILADPRAWGPGVSHTAEVRSDAPAWSVTYLEAATHEGRLSDPLNVLLLPKASRIFVPPGVPEVLAVWVLIVGLLVVPVPTVRPKGWLVAHRVASGLAVGLLAAIVVVPLVSPYNLVLSTTTFGRLLVVLLAWRIWGAAGLSIAALRRMSEVRRGRIVTAGVALVVAAGFGRIIATELVENFHGNYSGFLHIAAEYFDHNPILPDRDAMRSQLIIENPGGYDGQFMYFMTFDPFLRRFHDDPAVYNAVVDAPPYRYGRIGLSLLTRAVAFDHWPRYPATMVWSICVALVVAAVALSTVARLRGRSALWGAAVLAVPGFWFSLEMGLPEPIAAALMLVGLWCLLRQWWVAAGLLCAASLLTRETGVIFVGCLALWAWMNGSRQASVRFAAIAVLPLALWRLYVGVTLYPAWGIHAFFFNPDDFGVPFAGFAALWSHVAAGTYHPGISEMARAAIAYPLLLVAGLAVAMTAAVLLPSPPAIAGVVYGFIAISLRYGNIWVHVGNGQRGTFDLFLMLALASVWTPGSPRPLRFMQAAFWVLCVAYVLFGSFDASAVRHAALPLD